MIRFHVDNIMSNKQVNNQFHKWLNSMYGEFGEVKATRGKLHNYLGLIFNFQMKGKVCIDMRKYMRKMVVDFEKKYVLNNRATSPGANDLFAYNPDSPKTDKEMKEDFHTFAARGLFAAKRGRPDTGTSVSVLTCLLYTSPSPRDKRQSRMPSSA